MMRIEMNFAIAGGLLMLAGFGCAGSMAPENAGNNPTPAVEKSAEPSIQTGNTKNGDAAEQAHGDVEILFSKPRFRFTLAEAAAGISIDYDVVVKQDLPDVIPLLQGCATRGPGGLLLFEQLSGNDQLYAMGDCGPGAPPSREPVRVRKGTFRHTFKWDGRNWLGPSDTGLAKGAPFPPGDYTLLVSSNFEVASGEKTEIVRIEKRVAVSLVK